MSTPLILDSLEIRNFRAFSDLRIERLGQVNLIVGKNNVGKTAFLEALWLYANRGLPSIIWQILETRNETKDPDSDNEAIKNRALTIKYLFYGRKDIRHLVEPIKIGSVSFQEDTLSIELGWYREEGSGTTFIEITPLDPENHDPLANLVPCIAVRSGNQTGIIYRLDVRPSLSLQKSIRCKFVPANGLNSRELERLWDSIALTNQEVDVIAALSIIAPGIERVNLLSDSIGNSEERIPKAKMSYLEGPIPLRSLGEGMNRLFGIALSLVNAKDGMLLMDEVESGLHYSVQPDVWRLIFETARRLNVQVFATTHSWDCIEAFQKAAEENKQEEGILIRLDEKKGKIVATEFDERRLGIATREAIEVR